jgi:6,7-dimethyl-8-ribityllumazine synthase
MATLLKNLSDFSHTEIPSNVKAKIAIVWAEWNIEITKTLAKGAVETLKQYGIEEQNIDIFSVSGSWELITASEFCFLSKNNYDGVIAIGCLIKGDTPHFEYISEAVSQGLKDVSIKYSKPVSFGVITTLTLEQAQDRAGGKLGNKGDEAAVAMLKMIALKNQLGA